MQQCGIYEQLITQLLTSRLDRERFYVGERQLEPAEAAVWLSRFLSRVLEYAVGSVTGEDQLQRQIELANQLLLREFNFEVRHSPMPPDGTLRIP